MQHVWKCWVHFSTQMNIHGRFWYNILESALHCDHQNIERGRMFWNNGVHPSRAQQTWRIYDRELWSCFGGLWLNNTFLRHLLAIFHFICHTSVFCVKEFLSPEEASSLLGNGWICNQWFNWNELFNNVEMLQLCTVSSAIQSWDNWTTNQWHGQQVIGSHSDIISKLVKLVITFSVEFEELKKRKNCHEQKT